jgi:hypothetical protein
VYPFTLSVHVALFLQGFGEHSLMLVAHVEPAQPAVQVQMYAPVPAAPFLQLAPFLHGLGAQSFASLLHVAPVHPAGQSHLYFPLRSTHVPLAQGLLAHWLIFTQLPALHPLSVPQLLVVKEVTHPFAEHVPVLQGSLGNVSHTDAIHTVWHPSYTHVSTLAPAHRTEPSVQDFVHEGTTSVR